MKKNFVYVKMKEKNCYDCSKSYAIVYLPGKLYCSEKDKLIKDNSKLCKMFTEMKKKLLRR